jgi:uncharacterized protein YggE
VTETTITVQGTFTAHHPAERATVSLAVHHESVERAAAFSSAVSSVDEVRASISALVDVAVPAIERWSSDSVQVYTERPWSTDGTPGTEVVHARVSVRATFADLDALAPWIEQVAAIDGVAVESLEWTLTPAKHTAVTTEVRSRAVQDAVTKATVYAQALGLASVRAIALADPGMLGDQAQGGSPVAAKFSRSMAADGSPALSLTPDQIEVTATVDARFIAA